MPGYLLDTDHLTLYEVSHPRVLARVGAQPPGVVRVSAVNAEEALRGRLAYLARANRPQARLRGYHLFLGTIRTLNQFPIVPFDQAAENQFQQLQGLRSRVGTQDLKIAAVALANRLTLLTRNRRHFGLVPGLLLDDWSV